MLAELEDVRDLLTSSARATLSERQLEVLEPEGEEEVVGQVDPSIQFLGLEWEAIFGKCFNLGMNIRIYRQRLGAGVVDTLTLALILRDLQRVEAEVDHHSRAVLRGPQVGGPRGALGGSTGGLGGLGGPVVGGSSLHLPQEGARQGVRYRKTKTEGLASKIADVTKRRSTNEMRKKKGSIVDSLSNLFKNTKL